jgi:non-canonical purine NTP pyrophosphatase (RdgB/HAM1 family)
MPLPPKLALATKNPGKIREILDICADWPVSWVTAEGAAWPDIEETGTTYRENALLKAMEVARILGVPAVADDSGIEVDALGGGPGVRSARFAGEHATDAENLSLLLSRVADVGEAERTARYRCVAACAWPEGQAIDVEETCEGRITLEPRGSGGFGYDPAFVPSGHEQTMAELAASEKNLISHRGKALRALGEALREEG